VLVTLELFVRIEIRFFYPFEFSAHCRETLSPRVTGQWGVWTGQVASDSLNSEGLKATRSPDPAAVAESRVADG